MSQLYLPSIGNKSKEPKKIPPKTFRSNPSLQSRASRTLPERFLRLRKKSWRLALALDLLAHMRSSASSLSEEKDLVQKYIKETAHVVKPVLLQSTKIADSRIQQTIDYSLEYLQYFERSLLMRLSCESVGGQPHRVTDCAVSVELLHLSSLVIDDILDDAPSRSGKKSLYRKHGIGQAIITAEILTSFSLASFGRALERVDLRTIEPTRAYAMWRSA